MTQTVNPSKIEFEDKPITPILTLTLVSMLVFVFAAENGAFGGPKGHIEGWLLVNVFNVTRFTDLLTAKDFNKLMACIFCTNFASFHILQMAFNCYFIFVFGKHVEQKLGPLLYLLLILFGLTVPLFVLQWDMKMSLDTKGFVGPFFLLTGILGTYMVFPPIPKSKLKMMSMPQQQKGQIFKRGGRPDPLDKYIANPWMFVLVFAAVQGLFHFWLKYGFWIFQKNPDYDNMAIYPALSSIAFGYVIASYLQNRATSSLKEGPMTLQALKTYHQLLDLDVGHEDALRGTARTLGLPYDKVKQWVAKNKGNLRVK